MHPNNVRETLKICDRAYDLSPKFRAIGKESFPIN